MMSVRSFFRNLICLLSIALASSLPYSVSFAGTIEGKVIKVADGDTITVLDSSKVQHRVRLAGIDAPERGQPYGNASRKKLRDLVSGKEVRVEYEKHDRCGRIVGKVWVTPPDCPTCGKTLDTGLSQIATDMAWWYTKYAHEQSPEDQWRYEFAEQEAKAKKVGLWQDKNPVPPREFRKRYIHFLAQCYLVNNLII
jgi:endonuclease YncB( thermonuclease family)